MEAPSELVGGNQNDQAAQPSAANQNNQLVQLSADKNKKRKKREADKKFRDGKKQKTEDMLKQNEKLKADNAELEKELAYTKGKLEQLKEDMEQTRETSRRLQQMVETEYNKINMFQRQLQLPFEMTEFGTGATGLPVHHPPEGSPIEESLGLLHSHLPQGLAHFPFGMTPDNILGTQEAWLPVHHPPASQPGTTMGSGRPGH